jgi:hypothetical protein
LAEAVFGDACGAGGAPRCWVEVASGAHGEVAVGAGVVGEVMSL